ncbi:hypothetical protein P7B02_03420 [Caulobacter segnis]|uniref:hypothetical protein n=1 Tax=Caulobacter segnis TaxID=88688 RepID=UPI00240FF336|nr:hypothetical protein [Caulobacter segnis]MDG2520581.1 hypothetical protein [Caulobacter segnis]
MKLKSVAIDAGFYAALLVGLFHAFISISVGAFGWSSSGWLVRAFVIAWFVGPLVAVGLGWREENRELSRIIAIGIILGPVLLWFALFVSYPGWEAPANSWPQWIFR